MNQRENEERMMNPKYKDLTVTSCESGEEYVFISYRGSSWKKVLTKIVYRLQQQYHLRIYFDKNFASETNVWIEQFTRNMDSKNCKAFLCFFDEGYVTSYATLLELMHAMNPQSKLSKSIYAINFPIDWDKLDESDYSTGLGVPEPDNPAWGKELKRFQYEFNLLKKKKEYENIEAYYDPEFNPKLRACDCKDIMAILQPQNKRDYSDTDEFYEQFIVEPLKKACPGVFSDVLPETKQDLKEETEPANGITAPIPLGGQKAKTDSEYHPAPAVHPILPVSDSAPGQVREWTYSTKKGANAHILWDGSSRNCKVLKGSVAAKESDKFATSAPAAKKLKDRLVSQGILNGLTFIEDYDCDKIATMINLLNGGSVSMPAEIKGRNLVPAEDGGNSADDISSNAGTDGEASVPESETLAETDNQPSGEHVYIYKNARIRCDLNTNVCTVLKGSKTQGESPKFATNAQGAKKLKEELKQKRIMENDIFLEDYTDSMAKLLNLINGGSVSAPKEKMKFMRES